jgi:hypothetical protein
MVREAHPERANGGFRRVADLCQALISRLLWEIKAVIRRQLGK